MRTIFYYVKWSVFIALALGAYSFVFVSVIFYPGTTNLPIAVSLISSGVAVITGIIALLKDAIIGLITRPCLAVRFFPYDKRDCHATSFRNRNTGTITAKTHYFRFRIENVGWRTAEDVEVTLEEVKQFQNGRYFTDTDFMPLRLFWSHWRESRYELSIPPGTYRHCDFGFVIDPMANYCPLPPQESGKLLFWFDVFLRPNTGRTSLLPGRYEIRVSAFGRNVQRASLTVKLDWNGIWHNDIESMLQDSLLPKKGFEAT
jgi:hypothetical protein